MIRTELFNKVSQPSSLQRTYILNLIRKWKQVIQIRRLKFQEFHLLFHSGLVRKFWKNQIFSRKKISFPNLFLKKIKEVYKTINEPRRKKPRTNITMKEHLRRQIIIPMSTENTLKFMSLSNKYIANINRALKNIKSEVMADFVHVNH